MRLILEASGIYLLIEATSQAAKAPDRCHLPDGIEIITIRSHFNSYSRSIGGGYSPIFLKKTHLPKSFALTPAMPQFSLGTS